MERRVLDEVDGGTGRGGEGSPPSQLNQEAGRWLEQRASPWAPVLTEVVRFQGLGPSLRCV